MSNYTMSQAKADHDWLGPVLQKHHIGRYTVVEYEDKQDGTVYFGGVVDGRSTNNSYSSLEEAIIGCIAIARDGIDTRADRYFFKMTATA